MGIYTGSTFTDIVVLHPDGRITINKSPTTSKNFSQGVIDAVAPAASSLGLSTQDFLERSSMFKHGTTVATNALITRRGVKVGLITLASHAVAEAAERLWRETSLDAE